MKVDIWSVVIFAGFYLVFYVLCARFVFRKKKFTAADVDGALIWLLFTAAVLYAGWLVITGQA
jgi:hypothetical protein